MNCLTIEFNVSANETALQRSGDRKRAVPIYMVLFISFVLQPSITIAQKDSVPSIEELELQLKAAKANPTKPEAARSKQSDSDPTIHQIYAAAMSGKMAEARTMIDLVLRRHPNSAKAHYVSAQLAARDGKKYVAQGELNRAAELDPGLSFAEPKALQQLKEEIGVR